MTSSRRDSGNASDGGQVVTGAGRDAEPGCAASDLPFEPDWTLRPGVLLVNAFTERGMTAGSFAESSGLAQQTVAGLMNGAVRVDGRIAQAIAAALGTSPAMWLNAQNVYDSDIARGARDVSGRHVYAAEDGDGQ